MTPRRWHRLTYHAVAPQTWPLHRVTCRTVRGAVMSSDHKAPRSALHTAPQPLLWTLVARIRPHRLKKPAPPYSVPNGACHDLGTRRAAFACLPAFGPRRRTTKGAAARRTKIKGERGGGRRQCYLSGRRRRPQRRRAAGRESNRSERNRRRPARRAAAIRKARMGTGAWSGGGDVRIGPGAGVSRPHGTTAAGRGRRCRVAVMGAARPVPHVVGKFGGQRDAADGF
ncbi:hypothetical protein SEVIR_5G352801v4 [Setaria viridis]